MSVVGVSSGGAGQPHDGVAMDADEASGGADAIARRRAVHRQDRWLHAGRYRRRRPQRRSQGAKPAGKAVFSALKTRRQTSVRGIPFGPGSVVRRNSGVNIAPGAIAVGPRAPARMASRAMTTTLTRECGRVTVERGPSKSSKCRTISCNPIR